MVENQVTPDTTPVLEAAMRRPEGVVANAPSVARIPAVLSGLNVCVRAAKNRNEWPPFGSGNATSKPNSPLYPAKQNAAVVGLTAAQMVQITGDRGQDEGCSETPWKYNDRWNAQPVLDFLYLGPSKMATNRAFLEDSRITKMISIRDSRFADVRMLMYDSLAASLGIEMECFDVPTTDALVAVMPRAVDSINRHMLSAPVDGSGASTGRVFVFCETGNIRSAAVVLAYIMSMYGEAISNCWEFAAHKRFCISLDDDTKRMLVSYEQLFRARCDVHAVHGEAAATETADDSAPLHRVPVSNYINSLFLSQPHSAPRQGSVKRSIEETMDVDDGRAEFARPGSSGTPSRDPSAEPSMLNLDHARYENRARFVPFVDVDGGAMR